MRNAYRLVMVAIIAAMFSYCSNRPSKNQENAHDASISLSVQEDVLKAAILRRLEVLEKVTIVQIPTKTYVVPMSASEPIHYGRDNPPE